ncbi:MAG: hypothetical protein EOO14_00395 [Chitinophagaceae bacterium]|nr:MAG: hypothetical protein EOO14_00395 [Chitinophagaceae bacterium]
MQTENLHTPRCIRTFTGQYVNVFQPDPETINIQDIAHHLSMQCRFGGALPEHYSVAQHSFHVSEMVDPKHRLAALLHDASEAYLVDVPSPVKKELRDYRHIEDGLMRVIAQKFGFQYPFVPEVHAADQQLLLQEWDCLMLGNWQNWKHTIMFCQPGNAKRWFLKQFESLTK